MNQNQPTNNDDPDDAVLQTVHNPLAVMQPGERVVCEIRRHPIGLVSIYFTSGIVTALAIAGAILAPYYLTFLTQQQKLGIVLAVGLLVVITLLVTYIAIFIYNSNRWIVTTDSITQASRTGLFDTHSEQLSLANLEDVAVSQDGILEQMLGFGTLHVESAGEHSRFTFPYCPNPNEYARKIIAAHEAYIANNPEPMRVTNRPLSTASFNQPQ